MTPARKPKGRTLAEFEPLQPAEELLLDACWQGEVARIANSRPEATHENNTVRAAFLRFLALGGDGQAPVHEQGVRLQGAWIAGTLDLASASVPSGLIMVHCQFSETPLFTGTNIAGTLNFTGSRLPNFVGQGMTVNGNFVCNNATFDGKEGIALAADRAVINGTVFLKKAGAKGTVRLLGSQIGGDFECSDATFDGKEGFALAADRAVINGTVFLKKARATGTVRLLGAQIGSNLDCIGATFDGKKGYALSANGAVIKGTVLLEKARATGTVRLLGAQIGSNLDCIGATFDGKEGYALSANGAVIKGTVLLEKVCTTQTVNLLGVQIGGNLVCNDATFDGQEGYALAADRAVIKGDIFLKNARAKGEVRLPGTRIDGSLICTGSTFDGKGNNALFADNMAVNNMFKFRTTQGVNKISLAGAHVGWLADDIPSWGKCIILNGFTYGNIAGDAPTDAATRLAWLDRQSPEHAGLNGQCIDFKPQPWKQLAKVLREMGHTEDARQVSIHFEERLRQAGLIGQAPAHWGRLRTGIYRKTCRAGHCLFGLLTGYGYRPLRLLAWMLGMWLVCALFFWCAALEGVFGPSSPLVFQHPAYVDCQPPGGNWYICGKLPEEYSGFSPLAYSLDVILPFVDLQQANSWAPLIPTPEAAWYKEILALFDWKHATRLMMWLETLFGWVSSLLMVAVLSGLAKRREE